MSTSTGSGIALLALVALAACVARGAAGEESTVGPHVLDTLRSHGSVEVMVALTPPQGYGAAAPDDSVRAAIARLQEDVLAALAPADFRLRQRYSAIPALAGTILSERGLRRLAGDPRVVRVDVDAGGGGGGGDEDSGDREARP